MSGSELADGTALERFLTDLEDGTFEVEVGDGSEIIATGIAGPR